MLKIEQFAADNGIILTEMQKEMIATIASGDANYELRWGRSAGLTTAQKVCIAYLQDGMKPVEDNKAEEGVHDARDNSTADRTGEKD